MSWEGILGFIIIAVVSSFFNKNKQQGNNKSPRPTASASDQGRALPRTGPARTEKQRPKRPGHLMEEVIREIQRGMMPEISEKQVNPVQAEVDTIEEPSTPLEVYQEPLIDETEKATANHPLNKSHPMANLRFDNQGVLQGIIMSEILGKPKSLR